MEARLAILSVDESVATPFHYTKRLSAKQGRGHLYFSPITERNSEGWQKGFTNVTPDAPQDSAAGKRQICFFSGI
jgi:hypothetical protein